ncbi:hypothetical protein [Silvanigrella aquatica]|uniref:Uncharacterized protein n=1 Tax=Silvanigrella aquatica TaxID=1915309 RepID=A0A1L4CXE7_9BACT|nr:hypothetical protein [Silvanigrella aquatica]APJ02616.1 hypothetical protein AXG55_01170 [Silvanigrella aquatica]
MKLKKIIFIFISIIFLAIIIKFNKIKKNFWDDKKIEAIYNNIFPSYEIESLTINYNKKNNNEVLNKNNIQNITDLKTVINSTKYNEISFKNYLKKISKKTVPGTHEWLLAPKTLAIEKKKIIKFDSQILWEDENFYYINEGEYGIKGTGKNYNPNYSLVAIDKDTLEIGIINGYFILKLKEIENNPKQFAKNHGVKFISYYPKSNTMIIRMENGTNITETFHNLKQSPSIKNVDVEVLDGFPILD